MKKNVYTMSNGNEVKTVRSETMKAYLENYEGYKVVEDHEEKKNLENLPTGLESNKKYTVGFTVNGGGYTTYIWTTSQKSAKAMLKEMVPDAKKIIAKHYD